MKRAVFIDRDGTINKEVSHPEITDKEGRMSTDPLTADELVFFPGVKQAFALLKEAGIPAIVVSNQAGYAKGLVNDEQLAVVKKKLIDELAPDAVYYCLHHEEYTGPCECKKPKKGMLLQAAEEHDIDINQSFMVGDRRNDMIAGEDCEACFLVDTRAGESQEENKAMLAPELQKKVFIVSGLLEAAQEIVKIVGQNVKQRDAETRGGQK